MHHKWDPADPVVLLREPLPDKLLRVKTKKKRLKRNPNVNKTGYEEDY
jgi:hypothetical protein